MTLDDLEWPFCVKICFGLGNTVFQIFYIAYMATRQLSGDTTVNDLGHISRSLVCFTSNFSKTVRDTAKVTVDY